MSKGESDEAFRDEQLDDDLAISKIGVEMRDLRTGMVAYDRSKEDLTEASAPHVFILILTSGFV